MVAGLPAGASPASAAQGRKTDRTPLNFTPRDTSTSAQRVQEAAKQALDGVNAANGLDGSRGGNGLNGQAGAAGTLPKLAAELLATRGLSLGVYDAERGIVSWTDADGVERTPAAVNATGRPVLGQVAVAFGYLAGSADSVLVLRVLA